MVRLRPNHLSDRGFARRFAARLRSFALSFRSPLGPTAANHDFPRFCRDSPRFFKAEFHRRCGAFGGARVPPFWRGDRAAERQLRAQRADGEGNVDVSKTPDFGMCDSSRREVGLGGD